jgi:hypothetical protein
MATVSAENPFAGAKTRTNRQHRHKKEIRMYISEAFSRVTPVPKRAAERQFLKQALLSL